MIDDHNVIDNSSMITWTFLCYIKSLTCVLSPYVKSSSLVLNMSILGLHYFLLKAIPLSIHLQEKLFLDILEASSLYSCNDLLAPLCSIQTRDAGQLSICFTLYTAIKSHLSIFSCQDWATIFPVYLQRSNPFSREQTSDFVFATLCWLRLT